MRARIIGLWVLLPLTWFIGAQQSSAMLNKWVHPGNETIKESGYQGAQTCSVCHQDALQEITHTVHWALASPIRNVQGLPDGSSWGMANRECALAGSTVPANWTASTKGRATVQAAGCGLCHIGSLASPPMPGKPATDAELATVDCLVCHAKEYAWQKRATLVKDASGVHWGADTSLKAALSITRAPTTEACLRCHEHSFSDDYKRGTPYTPENDVHAEAGLGCMTCHVTEHHRIAKGQYESDMVANDMPDVAVTCTRCHGDTPHGGERADALNLHAGVLACQTCHIPQVSGIVYEDWGKPIRDDIHGKYSALSRYDHIPAIPGAYVPTDTIRKGHPSYIWRVANRGDSKDAQSWMANATASIKTEGARIFPVRGLTQVMLFDKKLKMSDAPGMGFLKDNPQMANFPLLLAPNREVYNSTGDVKAAIDAGMKPYEAWGLKWSGEWMAMEVPGTSYISVNHGVKNAGLPCKACHSRDGVMDYTALGYTTEQAERLRRPR
ncbi:MAG TPA: hypothetical protein PK435_10015 [Thermoanaerobaculaceae bacterium]|nr:hypothetical protein [Thermoanaerobaculaceae bacterium]